ncbi:MAG: LysR substrate-binding domain-containing protein [Pseudomonadota bacterium]
MNVATKPQLPLLDLDLMRTLVAISETGNFSAAAEAVFRTPSAVSMQVKRIEQIVGRPVFTRNARSVTLTTDGELLLSHARRVLALNREILANFIAPDMTGTVRMGALDHAAEQFLPSALCRFRDSYPGIVVDVTVENSQALHTLLDRRQLDLVLVTCGQEESASRGIETLFNEPLVWAGLKGGVAADQTPIPVSVWEEGCIWRETALAGLEEQGREYRINFKSAAISGQKAGILADLAIAPLPISSCDDRVVELGPEHGLPPLGTYILGMKLCENPASPIKVLADHFRALFS